jgi:hypothetical protein
MCRNVRMYVYCVHGMMYVAVSVMYDVTHTYIHTTTTLCSVVILYVGGYA